jgi:hypothetical protein
MPLAASEQNRQRYVALFFKLISCFYMCLKVFSGCVLDPFNVFFDFVTHLTSAIYGGHGSGILQLPGSTICEPMTKRSKDVMHFHCFVGLLRSRRSRINRCWR